jgi:methylenetetrahydrofolate dehydrogenase (NADP+)/methenyltetrahydrofolate cyclohydrolase
VGKLVQNRPTYVPCTPAGIMELLDRYHIPIEGRRAVILGRSDIVGKPMALLLMHRHATVTICHSRTPNLPAVAREADILVCAIGRTAMVTADYVKPGAVVIDVGINKLSDRAEAEKIFGQDEKRLGELEKKGYTLIGDVNPKSVSEVAGYLTPVPGGVGPLTIAMLMKNTVAAAKRRRGVRE